MNGIYNIPATEFDTDFKAEVVAAELINNAVPAEQIIILMLGPLKRSFRKDVDEVREEISDYNKKEYTLITTHKEGLYDMLPEGLFHEPALPKSATTQKEIVESIKKHKTEERNARRFFLPFEAGVNHLRIQLSLFESRLDKRAHHAELVDIFKGYWGIFKFLDNRQSDIFLQVLPLIHDIRDDYVIASTLFELVFLLPVRIEGRRQLQLKPLHPSFSWLDDCRLGIDMTTGNSCFDGGGDEVLITIGPMDNAQLKQFLPGQKNQQLLEQLCDYLLPVSLDIITRLEIHAADKTTRLADADGDHNSTLGTSTYI